ncbi:MAG: 1-(5-phosphoribosyl)-5-[Oscillospiraceae bacterium]|nr:1-(5-phosphoribosyl)-5-[(5-phosphoribosylamino)methylideneamino]imidazole-4-carboxamide isomerase [Oscillospiraceae bacterium]
MLIFPAIDLYEGKAVRLYKGDYDQMTVYSENPIELVEDFVAQGAKNLHLIDLEGAKTGQTPNLELIRDIRALSPLFTEVGGGIRSMNVIEAYLDAGVDRVILGTAAVTNPVFLAEAVAEYGDKIAVGADIKNGYIAIHGWTESSGIDAFGFCRRIQELGVKTLICTDISRDGAMQGTNRNLYRTLVKKHDMNIIASGGISSIEDIRALREMELHGAVIGKAYYTKAIDLREAIEVAK